MSIIQRYRSFFNPEYFQGWGKTKKYFEGWYFKIISADGKYAMAIIPGIAMDANGNKHAFIQVLDGKLTTAEYFRFPADEFIASQHDFDISIGKNRFSSLFMELHLPLLSGRIEFEKIIPWPKPFYSPGIMGPYAFAPFLECYHGVVSMDHGLLGTLKKANAELCFDDGRGYIEKDWGRSFPEAYVWMQCNHFSETGISLKLSVAKIPWVKSAFVGFIAGFWYQNKLIRFTTYNRSRLIKCHISMEHVEIILENSQYLLDVKGKRSNATTLASPIAGFMDGRIEESMTSEIVVTLTEKSTGKVKFSDTGEHAAMEVAGKISEIATA